MSQPSLWDRVREARVGRILAVYLGASWVVLQIIETVIGLLTLPSWVGPLALLLLLIGLFVVLATAWVQALPQTTAREEAGEVPTDWQVAPADVLASLKQGRLPHLTWGRALLGGVVALSLLFGAAGMYVVIRGPGSLIGPAEAGAEGTASGIAVLPFHVTGPSLELYREGMVDLVSANLDGLSGYRAIDSRTVLARWNRDVGDAAQAELDAALRVAAGTGARYAVVGNGVEVGARIRFTADIYDLDTRDKIGGGQVEGAPDEVLRLVDALTVEVMRSLLDADGRGSAAQDFRLASLLTRSVPALRAYLEGDALFRRGHFDEARSSLERAVQEDSTFALAHWRLGEAIGWTDGIGNPESQRHKRLADQYGDRLPPREATLLGVSSAISNGRTMDELEALEAYLRRYPDDPDGWYVLGEVGLHSAAGTGITDARVEKALYEAVALDPSFGPYYEHAIEWASARQQWPRADSLTAAWVAASANEHRLARIRGRGILMRGEGPAYDSLVSALPGMEPREVRELDQFAMGSLDADLARLEPLRAEMARRFPNSDALSSLYAEEGRFQDVRAVLEPAETSLTSLLRWAPMLEQLELAWNVGDPAEVERVARLLDPMPAPPSANVGAAFTRAALHALTGDRAAFDAARADLLVALTPELINAVPASDTAELRATVVAVFDAKWLSARGRHAEAWARVRGAEQETFFAPDIAHIAWRAGDWPAAIRLYEGISRARTGRSLAKYRLGRAYEETGDPTHAAEAYRAFLSRFHHADPGIPAVEEARAALARLGG